MLSPGGLILLGFQAGSGGRVSERAYGHELSLHGVLHEPREIARRLEELGFEIVATVDRAPMGGERSRQGSVTARRP